MKTGIRFFNALGLAVAAYVVPASDGAKAVSVCHIVHAPDKYDRRRISFRAHIESDGMHGAYLAEPECDKGIMFESDGRADWTEMSRIMDTVGTIGTARKSVEAWWVGVIHVRGPVISFSADYISNITYQLSDGLRRKGK